MTTLWAEQALTAMGWQSAVTVEIGADGRIARVEADTPPAGIRLGALLPAPANLHSHAFQRAMAGLTERRGPDPRDTFWTWRQLMFRFLDQLTPEDVEAITAFVQMEMLEAGYAAVAEFHYLHHAPGGAPYANPAEMCERIAAAAATTGIGLTLLPVLYTHGGCDGRPLGPGQIRFGNDIARFARLLDAAEAALAAMPADTRLGTAPHSLRAVDGTALAEAAALRPQAPLHMHLAEQVAEVEEVEAARGARPVDWLLDNADVSDRWCLIHCTQMTPAETVRLAATGAVAGLCPITESNLGDGIFDGVRFVGAGGRFGIGSDSNLRISLSEELRTLDHSQRLRDRSRAALATSDRSTGRVLFDGAVAGGALAASRTQGAHKQEDAEGAHKKADAEGARLAADAAGPQMRDNGQVAQSSRAGAIAAGNWADLLSLDTSAVNLEGRRGDTLLDCWIFAGGERMITDVWAAGRHMVTGGRHIHRDRITARWRAARARLSDGI